MCYKMPMDQSLEVLWHYILFCATHSTIKVSDIKYLKIFNLVSKAEDHIFICLCNGFCVSNVNLTCSNSHGTFGISLPKPKVGVNLSPSKNAKSGAMSENQPIKLYAF